jgi:hypothetical protein
LLVSGETKLSKDQEENGYTLRERRVGRFSRALRLPEGVKVRLSAIFIVIVGPLTDYLLGRRHQGIFARWYLDGVIPEDI